MKNVEFDYITKEQAIELAKLGFPQEYDTLSLDHYYTNLDGGKYRKEPPELVLRWLRDEKKIFIFPSLAKPYLTEYTVEKTFTYDYSNGGTILLPSKQCFYTCEDALYAGINRAIRELKMLKFK